MKKIKYLALTLAAALCGVTPLHAAYELVWSDEFDCDYVNTSVWSYETGGGGWGNNESQYYTNRTDNSSVSDGILKITAKRESYNGSSFTSARLISKNKVMCKYGKVEALIKCPAYASGVWPAFWMLGSAKGFSWPWCGEIDILEMMCKADASTGNTAINTYHWNYAGINGNYAHGEYGANINMGSPLHDNWYIYGLEWTPDALVGYIANADGSNRQNIATLGLSGATDANGLSTFTDYEFFLILNVALGGTYVGTIPDSFTSCEMLVDWVRIYQDRVAYPTSTLTDNSAACGDVPGINTDYVKVFRDNSLDGSVLDWSSAPFNIWEGTMSAATETAYEGDGCIALKVGTSTWYGGGWAYSGSALDYSNLKNYTLHFRLKTSSTNAFTLTVGDKSIQFTPSAANQWVEYNLPVSSYFNGVTLGVDASFTPLSFNQGTSESGFAGRTFAWDDVYFYIPGGSATANLTVNEASNQIKRTNGTATFTVSGSHLSGNVTLKSSNSLFQLSKTTLTPVGGSVNETITVTYTGDATANTVITASCGSVEAQGRVYAYFSGLPQIESDYVVLLSDRTFDGSVLDWGGSTFNIWMADYLSPAQATMTATTVTPYQGDGCMALKVGSLGWYGAGYVVNSSMDYANLNNYTLHFAYYTTNTQPFTVSVGGSSLTITPSAANRWIEYEVPVADFYLTLGELSSFQPFSFFQGTGETVAEGRVLAFDDVYFYIPGGSGIANLSVGTPWTIDGQGGTATFTVSGSHLTGNVTLKSSNSDFVLSKTTLTPVNGLVNETITVTYTNSVVASSVITVKSGDLSETTTATAMGTSTYSSCSLTGGTFGQADPYMAQTWDWTQVYDYTYSVNGTSMSVTLNNYTTTQWQAQFWMVPSATLSLEQGNTYTVKAAIKTNASQVVTVKAVQNGDSETYLVNESVTVPADELYMFSASAQAPAGLTDVRIVFDFGGAASGFTANVYNVEIGEKTCYDALDDTDEPEPADTESPSAPGALSGTPSSNSIALSWGASTDNIAVTGYNIYVNGTKSGSSSTASYTVTGLDASTAYSITVEAYDAAGNVSPGVSASFTTAEAVAEECNNVFETYSASRNVVNENGNWYEANGLHQVNGATVTIAPTVSYTNLYVVLSGDDETLESGKTYVLSGTLTCTGDATASVYIESRSDNEGQHMFDNNQLTLTANVPVAFSVEATASADLSKPDVTLAVENGPANVTYTLTNLKLRDKSCIGTEVEDVAAVREASMTVWPNPARQTAVVKADKEPVAVALYNLAGGKVASFDGATLDVSGLNPGMYVVVATFADGTQAQGKLVRK